jgi:hypothetical protein
MGSAINSLGQLVTSPEIDPVLAATASSRANARRLPIYAAQSANAKRYGGITVSGIPVGTDVVGIALLTGAHDYMAANPTATAQFVISPTQSVTLDKAQIDGMWAAVTSFIQACFAAEASVNAGIAAGTITDRAAVDAAFAAVTATF